MSSITINSNISALNAQRRLGQSTRSLSESFTRLSSGLRINKASDDASGLAISADLAVDARVYQQGIRNVNDAVGLLNIAESATQELSNILIRQRELATQSANGTLGDEQREAINEEAQALSAEYNRIIGSTEFNDLSLIDGSLAELRVQAGYGENGGIAFSLGEGLERNVGDGTFTVAGSYDAFSGSADPLLVDVGDFNGDGNVDLVYGDSNTDNVQLLLGNGDGSFRDDGTFYATGENPRDIVSLDLNNDGLLDVVTGDRDGSTITALLGNGDGTFKGGTTFDALGLTITSIETGDFNNDGFADIIAKEVGGGTSAVLLGQGNGQFGAAASVEFGVGDIEVVDLNGDGFDDVISAGSGSEDVSIHLGNGDGSFQKSFATFNFTDQQNGIAVGDFNGDAEIDFFSTSSSSDAATLFLGNGDGTFDVANSFDLGTEISFARAADLNDDGLSDLITYSTSSSDLGVLLNNGNGEFAEAQLSTIGASVNDLELADFNNDGALDAVTRRLNEDNFVIGLANTTSSVSAVSIDLSTRSGALSALDALDTALQSVGTELGRIGAVQSRLSTASSNLRQARENVVTAASQITDADLAEESARLVRNQILQQAGAAILAQANQAPALALQLLG